MLLYIKQVKEVLVAVVYLEELFSSSLLSGEHHNENQQRKTMLNNHSETVNMDMSIFQSDSDFRVGLLQEKCKGQSTNEGYNRNVQPTLLN